jgi:uncharacterized protein YqeY
MLIETLKTQRIQAMKDKQIVAKNLLTTLLGELEGKAKRDNIDINDEMVVQTCKKFIASNEEVIAQTTSTEAATKLKEENVILNNYLPKQLTEEQIGSIIKSSGATNVGDAMKFLKEQYAGQYDSRLAVSVYKEMNK